MKILMVGLGGIGQRHVRNLRTLFGPTIEILALRHRNNLEVLTDQLGIEEGSNLIEKYAIQVCQTLDDALSQKPDAVFICNPTSLHMPIALQAARAGCNLFIEKPLSDNLENVDELIDIVEKQRLKAVVGYQMRFHPCLMRLQTILNEHTIGNIIAVRVEVGEYMPGWHTYEDYRQLYASKKNLGGGVILTQIHELDYIYWLFGLPRRVFAIGGHLSNLDIDVEDTANVLMECEVNGRPIPISLHMDFLQLPPSRTCEIIGEAGKIIVDLRTLQINVFNNKGRLIENVSYEGYQRNQPFLDELRYFLQYLKGDEVQMVTVHEAVMSLRMAIAIKASMESATETKL